MNAAAPRDALVRSAARPGPSTRITAYRARPRAAQI